MIKIAIWGFGKYGRRMFESLTRFSSEKYEVVRIYDKAYQQINSIEAGISLQVHNPDNLLEDYKKGLFELVLLCIFYDSVSRKPKQFLQDNSIPELHLGCPDDIYPLCSFEQGIQPFEIDQAGYAFCVIKNLCGAMANYESNELLYLYDNKGRVLKDHWAHYGAVDHIAFVYDYPFDFRNNKAEKHFFKGKYCILTKKYAGNYWHFTYQCLDIVWILEKAGYQGNYIIPNQKFCSELLLLLDIAPERIISLSTFEHNKEYVFEEVFYVVNVKPFGEDLVYSSPVLREMADFIKKKLPINPSLPKKIYIKRIGKRKLLGADGLLAEYGFTTMVPEEYSVLEQMTHFYNADIIFCVHGANSTNCLYMREGTVFVEAFSSYWMNRCNLYTIASGGVHYLPVSSLETVWNNPDGMNRDFTMPEVLLRMTIQNAFLIYEANKQELG